jgi:hypothetical protein
LDIPTVTAASLVVDTGTAVQRFELSGAIGQTVSQADNGRLTADLGAIGAIDLAITLRQSSRGIPAIAARRYWVHAAAGRFQVECEIDPGEEAVRRGTDLPIVVLGGRQPILTSADWAVQASEMISPQRQLLTFRALRDNPEPIRLLWDIAADESPGNVAVGDAVAGGAADATDGEAAETVVLPDVISAGSAATPDAFIALQAGEGYRLTALQAPAGTESNSADAIDAFVARWKGYRSTAGQVIRSSSPLVRLALRAETPRPWLADERHHLHVRRGEMLLTYQAKITPGNPSVGPLLLKLPSDLEIRELTINGAAVVRSPRVNGGIAEVALPRPTGAEPIAIRLVAHQTHEIGEPFDPPRARISPVRQASGTYTLTRDHGLRVEEVVSSGLPELDAPDLEIAAQLLGGWVPCWTWKIAEAAPSAAGDSAPPADSVRLGGEFRAERMAPRLEVVQQTAVRWSQSRWMTEVVIRAEARGADGESQPLLDDLNIELPTAWSDQLDVEPAEAWSSQPAIDPATKVVRIRPDAAARSDSVVTVRIRGFRIGEGASARRDDDPVVHVRPHRRRRSAFGVANLIGHCGPFARRFRPGDDDQ